MLPVAPEPSLGTRYAWLQEMQWTQRNVVGVPLSQHCNVILTVAQVTSGLENGARTLQRLGLRNFSISERTGAWEILHI